ncbi:MAG TPA: DUF2851 family protein [Ignavibacteriaceae bacterium]|nr:DUF2851 family protein [Ignavibacteriaceae bacterium]
MSVLEKYLYDIWKEKKFSKDLITADDQKIEIIDAGLQNNKMAGPDFLNARVKIGNITFLGDIEIDSLHNDWKAHGHFLDKKYNKIILHLVASKEKYKPFVFTRDGRKVQSICMIDYLDDSLRTSIQSSIKSERTTKNFRLPCSGLNDKVSIKIKLSFLLELGIERFNSKSKRILHRLKEIIYLKQMNIREPIVRYDFGEEFFNKKFSADEFGDKESWQQLTYEMIFEALGYSKNKDIMLKLAKAVNVKFLSHYKNEESFHQLIESALFNVSGLIPNKKNFDEEESSGYIRQLTEDWNKIRNKYDGPLLKSENWHFFKLRPANFPTIRISGGAKILVTLIQKDLFKNLIDLIKNEEDTGTLTYNIRNLIIMKEEGFWQDHFVFDKKSKELIKYSIGISRADEIIVNVLLPILLLYFEIFPDTESLKRIKNLFINYIQEGSNKLVNQVASELDLKKASRKSINYQGMIELFRNYCIKERCLECKIGEKIFN